MTKAGLPVSFRTGPVRYARAARGRSIIALRRSIVGVRRSFAALHWPDWVIPGLYLLISVGLTWRVWSDPTGTVPTNGTSKVSADIYINAWFMRYTATALAHGHLPALVTTAVNAPQGVNAMWNTSMLLPATVLTPLTLAAGPIASLTVLLTAGFAGSATALYVVLRRWGAGFLGAGLGGAIYGFSPAILVAAEDHYHLQFAVLPPLIVSALLRLVTGRGRPVLTGIWLGLLVAAQVFIAEELLVDTVLAGAITLVVLAACRPSLVLRKIGGAAAGLAIAGVVVLVLAGHALWVQFRGPLAETGSPWQLGRYGNVPADFVTAPDAVLFHGNFRQFLGSTRQFLVECYAYLGWPLLGLIAVTAIFYWRDLRVRLAALTFALLELLSVGAHAVSLDGVHIPGPLLPWHWMRHVPLVSQALPQRLSILADGAAAAALAFGVNRALASTAGAPAWRRPVIAAGAALALLPVIPRPIPAAVASSSPPGFRTAIAGLHLRSGAPVLVLPPVKGLAMEWQAVTGAPISLVGGYCIVPDSAGHAVECDTYKVLTFDEQLTLIRMDLLSAHKSGHFAPPATAMAATISDLRPAAVLAQSASRSPLGRYLTTFFGPPTVHSGDMLGWRLKGICGYESADLAPESAPRQCAHPQLALNRPARASQRSAQASTRGPTSTGRPPRAAFARRAQVTRPGPSAAGHRPMKAHARI